MPWWFWVLLWGALIVSAVAFLAVIILPALKRGLTLLDEAFTLVENVEDAVERANESTKRRVRREPQLGVFTPVPEAYNNYEQGKQTRRSERIKRRVSRRDRLGQPQNVGDLL
ncbi:MAG: hypothetical protein Q4P78_05630 [Rothia sp. (in: high G+C Gram-positive bacteria)]|uniref:hypothetical protein n=1 Tax=Rothia sp. (in: high G+C Gram-positive bacteria) TaxID=1885016 RepID=UPI0026DF6296|nr:hypothetical protein [Rothia sp. (in: high G+C Gram-positive bacteria)]MDO5750668.1 hypothetical protein [Rothia sp. (in: high G+C Gram-positive bacteria)]